MKFSNYFVKATNEFNDFDFFVPAPYFRRSTDFKENGRLTLTIACCGFYELYLNGQRVTKGRLAPYISNPDDFVYADTYTFDVEKGESVIGLHLGNGFVNDPAGHPWGFEKARFRSAPSFSLSAEFEGDSGEKIEFDARDFKTHPSPIIFDEFRLGERYDARLEIKGWCERGFDDSEWHESKKADMPRGEIRLCTADPVLEEKELSPINIRKSAKGYIYEFPENRSGVCRLKIKGERGQEISLRHSDKLKPDGELEMLQGVWFPEKFERDEPFVHRDIYTCRGEGIEEYTPTFTYHGFCFVEVEGISEEQATEELLTFVVINSALKTSGGFKTSDPELSHLQFITRQSDLSNFVYFPTDCPQREKQGWLSDASISCEQMMLNFHTEASLREWYKNIAKAQNVKGINPPIVPTANWGYNWVPFVTGEQSIIFLPYYALRYRGDTGFAKEAVPTILRYLECVTHRYENGKFNCNWAGEIPSYGLSEDVKTFATGAEMECAKYYRMANYAAKIFEILNLPHHKAFAEGIARDMKNIFRTALVKDECTIKSESQTGQAMAIFTGLFDERENAFARLVEFVHRDGDRLASGIIGTLYVLHTLIAGGEVDLALKIALTPDYPSYNVFIKEAISFWERFNVYEGDTTTHNHHYFGDISAMFIRRIAGLEYNPDADNLKRVDITPSFPEKLADAEAYFETNFGKIASSWKRDGKKILLTLALPEDFEGRVILPKGYRFENGERFAPVKSTTFDIFEA